MTDDSANIDTARIEAAVREILAAIGEDPSRDGLLQTPRRVAEAYTEFFAGVGISTDALLADSVIPGESGELVVIRDIEFRSICEHHLLPFLGRAHVAYLPDAKVVGLGTIARLVEVIASRPQLQERLTEEIADALETGIQPLGVLVVLDAVQGCVTSRGPRQVHSSTVTLAGRGTLAEAAPRQEALAMIGFPHE
ncbi:MAG: folE [Microbacteriaceae bacterium]|nr:folE [Microbacteriaceae bacterium]